MKTMVALGPPVIAWDSPKRDKVLAQVGHTVRSGKGREASPNSAWTERLVGEGRSYVGTGDSARPDPNRGPGRAKRTRCHDRFGRSLTPLRRPVPASRRARAGRN